MARFRATYRTRDGDQSSSIIEARDLRAAEWKARNDEDYDSRLIDVEQITFATGKKGRPRAGGYGPLRRVK
jgi:hypothetical protein